MYNYIQQHKRLELLVLLVIFIVFFGMGAYILNNRSSNIAPLNEVRNSEPETSIISEEGITDRTQPWMELLSDQPDDENFNVGDVITVRVVAHSGGRPVSGYDAVLQIGDGELEVGNISSVNDQFMVYPYVNGSVISITGTKDLSEQQPTVFENAPVVEIQFVAKQPGSYQFSLMKQEGAETTKFVDDTAEIMSPQLQGTTVTVMKY